MGSKPGWPTCMFWAQCPVLDDPAQSCPASGGAAYFRGYGGALQPVRVMALHTNCACPLHGQSTVCVWRGCQGSHTTHPPIPTDILALRGPAGSVPVLILCLLGHFGSSPGLVMSLDLASLI